MSLLDELNGMIDDSGMSKERLAELLQKPSPTLRRELNPYDDGAKAGLELLVPAMEACKSIRPLEYLAARFGYRLVKIKIEDPCADDTPACGYIMAAQSACHDFFIAAKGRPPYTSLQRPMTVAIEAIQTVFAAVRVEQCEGRQVALSLNDLDARRYDAPRPTLWERITLQNRKK